MLFSIQFNSPHFKSDNRPNFPTILPPTINVPPADQTTSGTMETANSLNTMPPDEEGHPNSISSTATGTMTIVNICDESMSENQ